MNKYKKEEEEGGGGGGGGGEKHKQLVNWNSFEPVFFVALWAGLKRQKMYTIRILLLLTTTDLSSDSWIPIKLS